MINLTSIFKNINLALEAEDLFPLECALKELNAYKGYDLSPSERSALNTLIGTAANKITYIQDREHCYLK